jgi:hypothetical protein
MPTTPRRTFRTRIHRRVAAGTLAAFALAFGVVTFAGAPLPQTSTATTGTTAAQTTTAATTSPSSSTAQPVSSSTSGQTSSATLTTGTS